MSIQLKTSTSSFSPRLEKAFESLDPSATLPIRLYFEKTEARQILFELASQPTPRLPMPQAIQRIKEAHAEAVEEAGIANHGWTGSWLSGSVYGHQSREVLENLADALSPTRYWVDLDRSIAAEPTLIEGLPIRSLKLLHEILAVPMRLRPSLPRRLTKSPGRLTGSGTVIAVIDQGIYSHPDFRSSPSGPSRLRAGRDFVTGGPNNPSNGPHGTQMASLAAGRTTGIAPQAEILPLNINRDFLVVERAFVHALENCADVVCLAQSWSRCVRNANPVWWRRICETLLAAGMLHATSVGNAELGTPDPASGIASPGDCPPPNLSSPASASSAISCGAYDHSRPKRADPITIKGPSGWSKKLKTLPYNDFPFEPGEGLPKPDLFAPAGELRVCGHRTDDFFDLERPSTSAATAITAGCLALLAQASKGKDGSRPVYPERIYEALVKTSKPFDPPIYWAAGGKIQVREAWDYGRDSSRNWW